MRVRVLALGLEYTDVTIRRHLLVHGRSSPGELADSPIIAAIVVAAGLSDHAIAAGLAGNVRRVLEIVLGSLVGLVVPWHISKLWMPPESNSHTEEAVACATGN